MSYFSTKLSAPVILSVARRAESKDPEDLSLTMPYEGVSTTLDFAVDFQLPNYQVTNLPTSPEAA